MPKITLLAKGINIGNNNYPNNSLTFKIIGNNADTIEIYNIHGKVLYNNIYTDFTNSSSVVYASPQAVINDLLLSYS
jgi:hypothetical protein